MSKIQTGPITLWPLKYLGRELDVSRTGIGCIHGPRAFRILRLNARILKIRPPLKSLWPLKFSEKQHSIHKSSNTTQHLEAGI